MDLIAYIGLSFGYILFWQLVLYMKTEMGFDFMLMVGSFVIGGIVGYLLNAYDVAFIVAMVMSLIFL